MPAEHPEGGVENVNYNKTRRVHFLRAENIRIEHGNSSRYSGAVRLMFMPFYLMALLAVASSAIAGSTRIVKVLPQFADLQGRIALNPSLYERDAYQVQLRTHPEQRSALQFSVQWGSRDYSRLLLRVELRGNRGKNGTTATIETPVKYKGIFTTWSKVSLSGEAYKNFGELSAWRASLWDGDHLVAEQKSFLW